MRSLMWGLSVGLLMATAVGLGPILVLGILSGNLHELDEVGGVVRYLTWAYSAGALGGLTAGILRPVARSGWRLRAACGLVLGEAFALQPIIFEMGDVQPGRGEIARLMGFMAFGLGFLVGPLMISGLRRSWPTAVLEWGSVQRSSDEADSAKHEGR